MVSGQSVHFDSLGGVTGVHQAGADDRLRTAASESEAPFSCSGGMNNLFRPFERLLREKVLQKGGGTKD